MPRQPRALTPHTRLRLLAISTATLVSAALPAAAQDCTWALATQFGSPPNYAHAMAFDSLRNVTVLFGGNQGQAIGATWEWNGSTWIDRASPLPAPARGDHAMAFDGARGVTVVFGGRGGGGSLDDTWLWDGTAWTQAAVGGPGGRYGHAMAFDSARGRVVLFGGRDNDGVILGDTWEWDGASWLSRGSAGPGPRVEHALAYDAARGRTVMSGGTPDLLARPTDTWEWDGAGWSLRASSGVPGFTERIAMVYDPGRARVVRYDGNFVTSQTWLWDGNSWAPLGGPQPPPRYNYAMAFDTLRGRAVLFGGHDSGGLRGDTWELGCACYANCDWSTTAPVLNVVDYLCFQIAFVQGSPYANCDGSTAPPVLNISDFQCFINKYAAGCP